MKKYKLNKEAIERVLSESKYLIKQFEQLKLMDKYIINNDPKHVNDLCDSCENLRLCLDEASVQLNKLKYYNLRQNKNV